MNLEAQGIAAERSERMKNGLANEGKKAAYLAACICALAGMWLAEPFAHSAAADEPRSIIREPETKTAAEGAVVSIDVARDRARVMSDIYLATLEVMHDRYFHGERAIVPARAMEDIFAEMRRQSKVETRWISVNLKAMSITHEPKTEFERQAAAEIEKGKTEFESVEGGFYRRATAVPLGNNCINCHTGLFKEPPKGARFAGLIVSIPVAEQ
jgi:hypothetical protein